MAIRSSTQEYVVKPPPSIKSLKKGKHKEVQITLNFNQFFNMDNVEENQIELSDLLDPR